LSDTEIRAWYAYMKVHLRLRYEMNRQLRDDSGVSLADYDVLVALTSETTGTMRITDLATRIGAERSRVSHQVQRMAERSLVTLEPNPDDKRITDVSLTGVGRDLLTRAAPNHIAFVRSVFLDALDPARTELIAEAFEAVYDKLVEHGTLPRPTDRP
jgi:DNA-binding MarR family transcriptional regulator